MLQHVTFAPLTVTFAPFSVTFAPLVTFAPFCGNMCIRCKCYGYKCYQTRCKCYQTKGANVTLVTFAPFEGANVTWIRNICTQKGTNVASILLILTLIPTLAQTLTQTLTQTKEKHYFASRGKIATFRHEKGLYCRN